MIKNARLNERWFSWKPKGLVDKTGARYPARVRYAPHENPEVVTVHVEVQTDGRLFSAAFPFKRGQLATMRDEADAVMVGAFFRSLAKALLTATPKPPVQKVEVTGTATLEQKFHSAPPVPSLENGVTFHGTGEVKT